MLCSRALQPLHPPLFKTSECVQRKQTASARLWLAGRQQERALIGRSVASAAFFFICLCFAISLSLCAAADGHLCKSVDNRRTHRTSRRTGPSLFFICFIFPCPSVLGLPLLSLLLTNQNIDQWIHPLPILNSWTCGICDWTQRSEISKKEASKRDVKVKEGHWCRKTNRKDRGGGVRENWEGGEVDRNMDRRGLSGVKWRDKKQTLPPSLFRSTEKMSGDSPGGALIHQLVFSFPLFHACVWPGWFWSQPVCWFWSHWWITRCRFSFCDGSHLKGSSRSSRCTTALQAGLPENVLQGRFQRRISARFGENIKNANVLRRENYEQLFRKEKLWWTEWM